MLNRFERFEKFAVSQGLELQPSWQRYFARLMLSNSRAMIERPRCNGRWLAMQRWGVEYSEFPPLRVLKRRFDSRMDARGVMTLAPETRAWIAAFLQAAVCNARTSEPEQRPLWRRLPRRRRTSQPLTMTPRYRNLLPRTE